MPSADTSRRYLSPPQLARQLGVGESKVLGWIRAGTIQAVNLAAGTLGRPRYRIAPEAVEAFLGGRKAGPEPKPQRRRRDAGPTWQDFFPEDRT